VGKNNSYVWQHRIHCLERDSLDIFFDAKIWVRGAEIHRKFRKFARKNIWMKKDCDETVSNVILLFAWT
jgi:hypothetical protein